MTAEGLSQEEEESEPPNKRSKGKGRAPWSQTPEQAPLPIWGEEERWTPPPWDEEEWDQAQNQSRGQDQDDSERDRADSGDDFDTTSITHHPVACPAVDPVDVPSHVQLLLHFHVGDPCTHTRTQTTLPNPIDVNHPMSNLGFALLSTTTRHHAAHIRNVTMHPDPYLQPTSTATYKKYKRLDGTNCNNLISAAYIKEARRLMKEARKEGRDKDTIVVKLNIFVYLKENAAAIAQSAQGGPVTGRATQKRIKEKLDLINKDPELQRLGQGQKRYLATSEARKHGVDTVDPPTLPNNATFNQIGHVDRQYQQLRQRTEEEQAAREQEYRVVPVRIGGQQLQIEINISALLAALRMPDVGFDQLGEVMDPDRNFVDTQGQQQQPSNRGERARQSTVHAQERSRNLRLPRVGLDEDLEDEEHADSEEEVGANVDYETADEDI
ncbi:hypothetical protein BG005_002253 [Podila minutissima]|nr:hypothetical protein BG005_002253 [Podila minutissima]